MATEVPAGWYRDPRAQGGPIVRYWDGNRWTDQTRISSREWRRGIPPGFQHQRLSEVTVTAAASSEGSASAATLPEAPAGPIEVESAPPVRPPVGSHRHPPTAWVRVFDLSPFLAGRGGADDHTDIYTGHGYGAIAVSETGVWVTNAASRSVTRLDPKMLATTSVLTVRGNPVALALFDGGVWVACRNGFLWRIDSSGTAATGIARLGRRVAALAAGENRLWALRSRGRLVRVESTSGEIEAEISGPRGAIDIAGSRDTLWVLSDDTLSALTPNRGDAGEQIELGGESVGMVALDRTLWIAVRSRGREAGGKVVGVDTLQGQVKASVSLPNRPRAITAGLGLLWVACEPTTDRTHGELIDAVDPDQLSSRLAITKTWWPVGRMAVCGKRLLATMNVGRVYSHPGEGAYFFGLGDAMGGAAGGHGGGGGGGGGHGGHG